MSQKFKAVVIDNQNEKFTREIKEIDTSHLKDGNVLVKIDYSSLNYKDALILNNGGKIVRKFPFVPGIDFSGIVIESEDNKFKKDGKIKLPSYFSSFGVLSSLGQFVKKKKAAEETLSEKNPEFGGKIQTNISKIKNYCKAEEYHQNYLEKN